VRARRWASLAGSDVLAASGGNATNLAPVPILPEKTLKIPLGGLTVLLTGGAGYQKSRRRKRARRLDRGIRGCGGWTGAQPPQLC
jgi:hypothetical protein